VAPTPMNYCFMRFENSIPKIILCKSCPEKFISKILFRKFCYKNHILEILFQKVSRCNPKITFTKNEMVI